MDQNYILNDLGEERSKYFNAVAPPIIQSSNFAFPDVASFQRSILDEMDSPVYTRGNNPTVNILRQKLAALEKAEDAILTASGIAAISAAVMSFVSQGDHIICVQNPYSWTKTLMASYLPRFGVETTFVDGTQSENIFHAVRPETRILYLESPNTYTYEIQDLKACAKWAKQHDIITIIDNSYSSPIFQNPIDHGIDIVVHSVSKYINGHSDVVAGVICGSRRHMKKIFFNEYMTLGAILSPGNASLIIRSLRTLPLRMKQIDQNTNQVIRMIRNHPNIEKLYYPFDDSFPQNDLARKQMSGCGGLFSIAVRASSIESVINFINGLTRFKLAVSWGGHESLILPIAAFHNLPERANPHIPWNYMRLYVGLEEADYLLEDLIRGLDQLA